MAMARESAMETVTHAHSTWASWSQHCRHRRQASSAGLPVVRALQVAPPCAAATPPRSHAQARSPRCPCGARLAPLHRRRRRRRCRCQSRTPCPRRRTRRRRWAQPQPQPQPQRPSLPLQLRGQQAVHRLAFRGHRHRRRCRSSRSRQQATETHPGAPPCEPR